VTTDGATPAGGAGASLPTYNTANSPNDILDYGLHYTSWSLGALYELTSDTSLFARASRGGRVNADRMLYSGDFNPDGSLSQHGAAVAQNFLTQQEIGVKSRGQFGDVRYSLEATVFHTHLTENNYDFTLLSRNPPQDPNISAAYRGQGLEFTGNIRWRGFVVAADLTYTDSKIESNPGDPASAGKVPQGMPKLLYRISPAYDQGMFAAGLSIVGHSSSYSDNDNTLSLPAFDPVVSAFAKVRPYQNLEFGVNISNLFNSIATAGGGYVQQPISPKQGIFNSQIYYGRLIDLSVRYVF
jgi:outer membrane receptor protein involved in Fe transport